MWVAPILLSLCYLVPSFDFIMVQVKNHEYMEANGFTQEQIEFWFSYPTWAVILWGTSLFAAELSGILLLCKKGLAAPASLVSLFTYVICMIRQYGFTNFTESHPEPKWVIANVMIFVLLLCHFLYARAMKSRGVLS